MIKKKSILLVLAIMILLQCTGCTTKYSKDDIEKYVKEDLGLKEFQVSRTYEDCKGDDGYSDKLWTIVDKDRGISFHVLDDYHWSMESVFNTLRNDYPESVFIYYQDRMPENQLLETGDMQIEAGPDSEKFNRVKITGYFKNKNELLMILEQLAEYDEFFRAEGYDMVSPEIEVSYTGTEKTNQAKTWANMKDDPEESFQKITDRLGL